VLGAFWVGACLYGQNVQIKSGTIAILHGKLLTISHGVIEDGTLLMADGKITQVGPSSRVKPPAGSVVVDARGMTVYPGLIDSESNLGLLEMELVSTSNDTAETSSEIFPHMRVYDAFHADTEHIPIARFNGITNAVVAPVPLDIMPGQDIFIQLDGKDRDEMILKRDSALPMNFTPDLRRKEGKFPMTRMGMAQQLRQTWMDAQYYMQQLEASQGHTDKSGKGEDKESVGAPKRDFKLEALIPYLKGEKPVVVAAYESQDLRVAMEIATEFHLKVVLNHLTHTQEMLDQIAAYKVPVIFGSIYDFPLPGQRYDAVYSMPAELYKRGVKLAFGSYGYSFRLGAPAMGQTRNLPYAAGQAVAYGLPYEEALKALTLNAAEIWGVADTLGSLDVGKTANVVIATGDPLDVTTTVKQVYIAGKKVSMVNRQTRLRDQYWPKDVPRPVP